MERDECYYCGDSINLDECEWLPSPRDREPDPCCLVCWTDAETQKERAERRYEAMLFRWAVEPRQGGEP